MESINHWCTNCFIVLFLLIFPVRIDAQNNPEGRNTSYSSAIHFDSLYKKTHGEFGFDGSDATDFTRWQAGFLPRLKAALGISLVEAQLPGYLPLAEKKTTQEFTDYTRQEWILWTEPTIPLPLVVLLPKIKEDRFPLVIATHGHGKNSDLYTGIYPNSDIAVQAAKEGYIAIAPTIRAFGSTRTEYDQQNDISFSCHTQLMHDLLVGRTPIGDRVWDMSRVIDWAINNLPVDTKRIAITGNSGGGTVALFTAACDARITVAVPSSYFCTFQGSIAVIGHCDCNYVPGILQLGEMSDVAGLIAPRALCVVNGIKDNIFPIEETRKAFIKLKAIYSAAGVAGNCEIFEGAGGHQYYPEGAWPFIKKHFASINK